MRKQCLSTYYFQSQSRERGLLTSDVEQLDCMHPSRDNNASFSPNHWLNPL